MTSTPTSIDNELTVKELEGIIDEMDNEMNALLVQFEALRLKKKEFEDKLKEKTDKETKTSEALKTAKSKAELLKEKIKKAHQELKAEIETPPE